MIYNFLPQVAAISGPLNWLRIAMIGILLAVVLLLLTIFIPWLFDFRRELRYLNSEIGRTEGREQQYWIEKKKQLWRSVLPFCRYSGH